MIFINLLFRGGWKAKKSFHRIWSLKIFFVEFQTEGLKDQELFQLHEIFYEIESEKFDG